MPNPTKKSDKSFLDAVAEGFSKAFEKADQARKDQGGTMLNSADATQMVDAAQRFLALSEASGKGASAMKNAAKGNPLLGLGANAVAAGRMVDPEKRQEAIDQVYDDAQNASAVERAVKGYFNPVETTTGIAAMLSDLGKSTAEAKKAERNAPSDEQLLKAYLQAKERKRLQEMRRADKVAPEEMRDRPYVGEQFT